MKRNKKAKAGFTLIELSLVILIIGAVLALVGVRTHTFYFWKEEGFLRSLSETIEFLHYQAVMDQAYYRMEIDLDKNLYRVGVMKSEDETAYIKSLDPTLGNIALELAAFLNPGIGSTATFIPPPSIPSLSKPVHPPSGTRFTEVRTMRGKSNKGKPYIMFSPRGFSEFSVIHLKQQGGDEITIVVNPFSGRTKIIRGYKDFIWTYGRRKKT
ncbi:MAG: prepilin-type N-terminal cleavage/methylation domain-containing protein [Candidatus Dadabacteria bacterium]|nr:MAG: prepilin-type N-terminal cleavage/methylation domain-containing protein [Candidatus Dadabacteria bacterium]